MGEGESRVNRRDPFAWQTRAKVGWRLVSPPGAARLGLWPTPLPTLRITVALHR
jgi:hypothetical protein